MGLDLVCTEFNGRSLLVDTESGECVFYKRSYEGDRDGKATKIGESEAEDLFNNLPISSDGYESVKEWMNW